jgi:hypothetical protein
VATRCPCAIGRFRDHPTNGRFWQEGPRSHCTIGAKRKLFEFEACLTLPPEISILFYSYPRIKILRFITIDQFKRKNTVNFKLLAVIASVTSLQSTTASAQLNCEPPSMLICQIGRCFCDVPREIILEGVNIRIIVLDEGFAKPVEMDKELQEKLEIAIKEMR